VCARAVSDEGWSSQLAAATALGISLYRVGYVIATGNLEAVGEPSECGGVTRGSLDSEIAWCRVETPSRGAGWEAPSHPLPMAVNRRFDDARDDFPLSELPSHRTSTWKGGAFRSRSASRNVALLWAG
jgi:hypothetical protein